MDVQKDVLDVQQKFTHPIFETIFCPSHHKGRAGSDHEDGAVREDDEEA